MILQEKTIFQKIIDREIKTNIIYEDASCIVIKDINPQAPIHFLIIPKDFFVNIPEMHRDQYSFGEDVFKVAHHLSKIIDGASEFRLIMNNGKKAGQCVFHAHVHFLAGF